MISDCAWRVEELQYVVELDLTSFEKLISLHKASPYGRL